MPWREINNLNYLITLNKYMSGKITVPKAEDKERLRANIVQLAMERLDYDREQADGLFETVWRKTEDASGGFSMEGFVSRMSDTFLRVKRELLRKELRAQGVAEEEIAERLEGPETKTLLQQSWLRLVGEGLTKVTDLAGSRREGPRFRS